MLFKRTAFAVALAAALVAAAPAAPGASEDPATLAVNASPVGADQSALSTPADAARGRLAWDRYFIGTSRPTPYRQHDWGETLFQWSSIVVCAGVPAGLAMGGVPGAVFGVGCGFMAWA